MKVYMVGNAHLDPAWLWRWPEGAVEAAKTCLTALELLEKHEGFIFTRGEAWVHRWFERAYPSEFERLKKLVREKRWVVVNGWIVQPDMNLPHGECFVRQSLYGKKYFREKFGIEPKIAYCVDSFGHSGTLPQIFKKCGYRAFVFMRPHPHEKPLPQTFRWRSADGSEVLAFRLVTNYETFDIEKLKRNIEETLKIASPDLPATMCFYGVGNHGGGPTEEQIEFIERNENYRDGVTLLFGSPLHFFDEIEPHRDKLPVVEGDLHPHAVGCYSVNLELKRLNRRAEGELLQGEALASMSSLAGGYDYPHDAFEKLWEDLLMNGFHDILGGTTTKEGFEDFKKYIGGVLRGIDEIKTGAALNILKKLDIGEKEIAFVVFNPTGQHRSEYFEFEPWMNWRPYENAVLIGPDGKEVPFSYVRPASLVRNMTRILFRVDVPPFGYSLYRFREGKRESFEGLRYGDNWVENDFLRISLEGDGELRVHFKSGDIELRGEDFQFPLILSDGSDTWGHDVYSFRGEKKPVRVRRIAFVEKSELRATILRESISESSTIKEFVSIYFDEPYLRTRFLVDYHDRLTVLKLSYRFPFRLKKIHAEMPYGFSTREPDGLESPMGRLLLVETERSWFGFASDAIHAHDAADNEVRLTAARCVPFAWHVPYELQPDVEYDYIDEGLREFELLFWLFGDRKGDELRFSDLLNSPLTAMSSLRGDGSLPDSRSLLEVRSSPNVRVEVLMKRAGGEYTLRSFETLGKSGEISVLGRSFEVKPYELKTLVIRGTDVLESDTCF